MFVVCTHVFDVCECGCECGCECECGACGACVPVCHECIINIYIPPSCKISTTYNDDSVLKKKKKKITSTSTGV